MRGGVIITKEKHISYVSWGIPLAKCKNCGKWARVLPIELLPRKTYGAQVIQMVMYQYLFSSHSLREAAGEIDISTSITVHYSTLWH